MTAANRRGRYAIYTFRIFQRGKPERNRPRTPPDVQPVRTDSAGFDPLVRQLTSGKKEFRPFHVVHVGFEELCVALVEFSVFLFELGFSFFEASCVLHGVLVFELEHANDALEGLEPGRKLFSFTYNKVLVRTVQ